MRSFTAEWMHSSGGVVSGEVRGGGVTSGVVWVQRAVGLWAEARSPGDQCADRAEHPSRRAAVRGPGPVQSTCD